MRPFNGPQREQQDCNEQRSPAHGCWCSAHQGASFIKLVKINPAHDRTNNMIISPRVSWGAFQGVLEAMEGLNPMQQGSGTLLGDPVEGRFDRIQRVAVIAFTVLYLII